MPSANMRIPSPRDKTRVPQNAVIVSDPGDKGSGAGMRPMLEFPEDRSCLLPQDPPGACKADTDCGHERQ